MTSDPQIERRIARLENETESIYELIDDFRGETRSRFDQIETTLNEAVDDLRGETRSRFDQHDARFDRLEGSLAEVLRRLPEPS